MIKFTGNTFSELNQTHMITLNFGLSVDCYVCILSLIFLLIFFSAGESQPEGTSNPRDAWLEISDDCLSVLTTMTGFILLPLNTEKMGYYFEAGNEEIRNELVLLFYQI